MHKVLNKILFVGFLIGFCGFVCACEEETNGDTGMPEIYELLETKLFDNQDVKIDDCQSVKKAITQLKNSNSYQTACDDYRDVKKKSSSHKDGILGPNLNAGYYMAAYIWIMMIHDNIKNCDDTRPEYESALNQCDNLFSDAKSYTEKYGD